MATTVNARRTQVLWVSGLNMLFGMWLFDSAFAVFAQEAITPSNFICGIAVIFLAAVHAIWAYDRAWLSWATAAIGAWVVVSPWVIHSSMVGGPPLGIIVSNTITGGIIAALGCWSATATGHQPHPPFFSNPTLPTLRR
jgi:hypothetical protein